MVVSSRGSGSLKHPDRASDYAKTFGLYTPLELAKFIRAAAKREGISINQMLNLLLLDGIRVRYGLYDLESQKDME